MILRGGLYRGISMSGQPLLRLNREGELGLLLLCLLISAP